MERGVAQPERTRLWGLAPWGWCAMVGAGVLAYLVIADRVGALGGGVLESVRGLLASERARWVLQWIDSAMYRHDAMSIALVFVGVASLHVSSVKGRGWRLLLFGMWFGLGAVMVEPALMSLMWRSFGAGSWIGILMISIAGGAIAFCVGAAAFPSESVRVGWGLWWICGVIASAAPVSVFGRLGYVLGVAQEWLPLAIMGSMVIWAVRARRSIVVAGSCRECRYDLSGTAVGAPCPECGGVGTNVV